MNIDTIRIFCDVVLHQSFSRGALVNDVSQSAATQSIHRLERHLGVQLVDRTRRPFILTPEGQICYDGFRSVLESYDTIVSKVQTLNNKESGTIRVGAIYSVGLYDLGATMRGFMGAFPQAKVRLELLHAAKVYDAVLTSEIDFGIVSYPMATSDITVISLASEKMVYVCSPNQDLGKLKSITLDQLHGTNFVAFDRDLVIRKEIDRFLRQRLTSVNITTEFENIETIKQAIEIGMGGSILPANAIRNEVKLGKLVGVPITSPKITRPLGIIHRQSKVFTPAMTKFIELLSESKWDSPNE